MDIEKLFTPSSIAIIGASTRPGSVGNDIVKNLTGQGFGGDIYPVNPNATELYGKKCFANIQDISEAVELAIVVVPAAFVLEVIKGAAEKGVSAVIVISAGFKEIGNAELEEEIRSVCDDHDIALLGPNCLGVINPAISMNASFATRMPEVGSIAFLSQSGALCTAMLDYSARENLGFSKFASIGNKAQIDEVMLMRFLKEDPETKVIVLYMEQLSDATGFVEVVRQCVHEANKPVLVVKSGVTSVGASASASHTGALAGNDAVYDAIFEKAGAIRVRDFDDLFEYLAGFSSGRLPKGSRTAVLTNAGGPGVLATDEIILQGLSLATLSEGTKKQLKDSLPVAANSHNPVDVLGDADAERYQKALELLLGDDGVDNVIVVLTPQSSTQIAETAVAISNLSKTTEKMVYAVFMGAVDVEKGIEVLQQGGVPVSRFPQKAVRTLSVLWDFAGAREKKVDEEFTLVFPEQKNAEEIFFRYPDGGEMSSADAMQFFEAYGFSVTRSMSIRSADEAEEAVSKVGGVAAFKILSPDISHKSDAGGVMLHVTPENAREAYETIYTRVRSNVPDAKLEGILVAEMVVEKGAEFILGSVKDSNLGHAVMVGFGGIYVEVFRDIAFGAVPVSKDEAKRMVERLKSKALLRGSRGGEMLDEEMLLESIGRMSHLLQEHPEIVEADINPLVIFAKGKGVKVLDARMTLERHAD